jgi:hypothetical protein
MDTRYVYFSLLFVLQIHRFPNAKKNPEQYAIWVKNVNRNAPVKFVPTTASRICSEHFSADMIGESGQRVMLKPNALPTIFPESQVCIYADISHFYKRNRKILSKSLGLDRAKTAKVDTNIQWLPWSVSLCSSNMPGITIESVKSENCHSTLFSFL